MSAPPSEVVEPTLSAATAATPSVPRGLTYHAGAVSLELSKEILTWLKGNAEWFPVSAGANARKVVHYGYAYDYRSGSVKKQAPPFPEIIERLCALIAEHVELPTGYAFDQCIINKYLPGQGIGAHTDHSSYGDVIACFTIGSGAEMEFVRAFDSYKLFVEGRSLYVMSGESRRHWTHSMRGRLTDPAHGKRGVRYSLTFRSVKK
jgi:alkylated DNA repair dioxygenase AlkB